MSNLTDIITDRQYIIFSVDEINLIDFNQILETSSDTLRKSIDGKKTFVKWDGDIVPSFVDYLTTKEGPYSYSEIIEILAGPEWSSPIERNM